MLAECRFESLDCAKLIAGIGVAAHPDGSDHLPIDHDRDAARGCEEIIERGGTRQSTRIVLQLRRKHKSLPQRPIAPYA